MALVLSVYGNMVLIAHDILSSMLKDVLLLLTMFMNALYLSGFKAVLMSLVGSFYVTRSEG